MEQPGERTPKTPLLSQPSTWLAIGILALIDIGTVVLYFNRTPGQFRFDNWLAVASAAGGLTVGAASVLLAVWRNARYADDESQARQRVRQAEDKLAESLRISWVPADEVMQQLDDVLAKAAQNRADGVYADKVQAFGTQHFDLSALDPEIVERFAKDLAKERKDERLTLAALWDVTHKRMGYYHQIVTGQARNSFRAAQAAMGVGFVVLVVFAVVAVQAKTTTGAVTTASLGGVGAAFAAYIGKTFIRSQESAASHLRAYFDQPLDRSYGS